MRQAEHTEPAPPRLRRRLRWYAGWTAAVLMLGAVVAYFAWRVQAQRAFDAQIASVRAAGEPTTLQDLRTPPVPDANNAVPPLMAAERVLWRDEKFDKAFGLYSIAWPLEDYERTLLRHIVEKNSEALALVKVARPRKGFDWQLTLQSPAINRLIPSLNALRTLADTLGSAAFDALARGNDAAAFKSLLDIRQLSRAAARQPGAVPFLVALGIDALANNRLMQMLPDMRIGQTADPSRRPVAPAEAAALTRDLLNDQPLREWFHAMAGAERVIFLDTAQSLIDGRLDLRNNPVVRMGLARAALRPQFLRECTRVVMKMNQASNAFAASPDYQAYRRRVSNSEVEQMEKSLILLRGFAVGINRWATTGYSVMTERHLVAAAVAVRWYACEHDGRLPATLEELVPRYLPAVPIDPMAANGGVIRYIPNGDRPRLYSVGINGIDDNGSDRDSGNRSGGPRALDIIYDLALRPRQIDAEDAQMLRNLATEISSDVTGSPADEPEPGP